MSNSNLIAPDPARNKGVLFGKLAAVLGEIHRVEKRGYNAFHKYSYATEGDLVEVLRPALAKNGVAVLVTVTDLESRGADITRVALDVTFGCGETGETYTVRWYGDGQDKADKGLYKAYTGAMKYCLMKTFLMSTGDDPEDDEDDKADSKRQGAKPSSSATPPPNTATPAKSTPPPTPAENPPAKTEGTADTPLTDAQLAIAASHQAAYARCMTMVDLRDAWTLTYRAFLAKQIPLRVYEACEGKKGERKLQIETLGGWRNRINDATDLVSLATVSTDLAAARSSLPGSDYEYLQVHGKARFAELVPKPQEAPNATD